MGKFETLREINTGKNESGELSILEKINNQLKILIKKKKSLVTR